MQQAVRCFQLALVSALWVGRSHWEAVQLRCLAFGRNVAILVSILICHCWTVELWYGVSFAGFAASPNYEGDDGGGYEKERDADC